MTIPQNPYIADNPVGGTGAFVGRADVLREVKKVLHSPNRNAIVLYGQRRIGKTSLLQESKRRLAQEGKYFPIYMDLQDKAAWPLAKLLRALAQEINAALHTEVTLPESGDVPTAFRETYIPQVLAELPAEASIVLLLDEFDVLDNPEQGQAGTDFFPYLRTFLEAKEGRLQFVFVIGRKPENSNTLRTSVFKGVRSKRVSLFSQKGTWALVRLAERNHTLVWSAEALQAVWSLTHGHPYLTQQLCEIVWENAYEAAEGDVPPTVRAENVHAAVPETLESNADALQWLWDGLPAVGKYVAAVLAEAEPQPVSKEYLSRRLEENGVHIVIHELRNALQTMKRWDFLEETSRGYRFRVELLRRWIAEWEPVPQVYQELESIGPLAQALYETGQRYYRLGQLEQAMDQLQQALETNPYHVRAGLLLAQILLAQGEVDEAVALLEQIYTYNPGVARPRLVQALLEQAESAEDEIARWELYAYILEISPGQRDALAGQREILEAQADRAIQAGDPEQASELYWQLAIDEYPMTDGFWEEEVARLKAKRQLAAYYLRVQKALAANHFENAQEWLQKILDSESEYAVLEPGFRKVLEDLLESVRHRKRRALYRLSPWNPLDVLRLLWWLLVRPRILRRYRAVWGIKGVEKVGNWLVSFWVWTPLLILTLAIALYALPLPSGALLISPYWVASGILGLAMLLTGISSANDDEDALGCMAVVAGVVAGDVAGGVASGVVGSVAGDVAGGMAVAVTVVVTLVMAFFVVDVVASSVTSDIVGSVTIVVVGVVAIVMAGGGAIELGLAIVLMRFVSQAGGGRFFIRFIISIIMGLVISVPYYWLTRVLSAPSWQQSVLSIVAFVVADVVTVGVGGVVKERVLQTGRPDWLSRIAFGVLMAAYAFLVWFSFLGGWRFFQVTGG